jgi:uncharacterized protein (DUF2141 family)
MKKLILIPAFLMLISVSAISNQVFNTSLTVTVRDELGNIVEGATIQLYEKEDDYLKEVNVVTEDSTDKKGVAKFKKLKPMAYFVLVEKEDRNNAGGGEQIGKLEEGKFNKVTIVIQ